MVLLSLPQELLLKVVKELHLADVETLAQTFNRRIHATCMPFLTKRIAARKHSNRMKECFGTHEARGHLYKLSGDVAEQLGFDGVDEISIPEGPTSVEYLDLNGDLSWMEPLDPHTAQSMEPYHQGPAAEDPKLIDKLIADAEKLGLELPPGFVTFMRSEELQYRIPSAQAAYFTLAEDGFRKCPDKLDNGLGGYIIRFFVDQQWCWVWNLYIYPGGNAVLGSPGDLNCDPEEAADQLLEEGRATQEEIDKAREMGFPLTYAMENDLVLHSLGFEEFLATTYYEELMFFVMHEETKVSKGLRDYIDHNYRKKGGQAKEEEVQEEQVETTS
ncbi:hypothetical protein NW759_015005 [Fusarium solani]|uniref:Uncharacterized protein n=1 Tax=Fusarium solani TaxID=169388 RepID=A0A9P9R594_FUSSL|nr:uncharacterized protein B0J15DRAFT_488684 [Fusarium solani]KAH7266470.1 hypothetical protein B0J15DRAFT_488684 [Fusarium solani]KAJ4203802.1 hypothetical protein NW759_015005 [Fusarium solani]